jgi:hypothetical protein
MSASLRDLNRRVDALAKPQIDVADLMRQGEARLRRRRATAVAAATMAVVLTVVGAATLTRGDNRSVPPPIDRPTQTDVNPPTAPTARQIVYSDVLVPTGSGLNRTVHLGDQVVETGSGFVHMDVTDDGVVYTNDGRAWFSDGGTPEQIGSHLCSALPNGEFVHFANRGVMSANTGSLAAWFECTQAARATLVVYDTASRRTLARRQMAVCGHGRGLSLTDSCTLFGLTQGQVYFNAGVYAGYPRPEYRFDVTTGHLSATTRKAYAADIRSHPRGLVVGDTWPTGTATDGIGQEFHAFGSRLVPWWRLPNSEQVFKKAFDTATGQAVRLRLPAGYRAHGAGFSLFEWLDADTVALFGGSHDDILTCRLSSGRCDLRVRGRNDDGRRIVPNFPLPG